MDTLLARAARELGFQAAEAIRRGVGHALLVTVDCDLEPLVQLWPVTRIAGVLRAKPKLIARLHKACSEPRAPDTFPVIVCAPGAAPTVSLQHLERRRGHYSIAYVKREREWFWVWAIWPGKIPTMKEWVAAEVVGLVQQSGVLGHDYEDADVEADETLRALLGDDAETIRIHESFGRAAYRESMGGKPNLREPRPGATKYAPRQGHDRPPSQRASVYHDARAVVASAKRREIDAILERLRGGRDTRSPLDRMIDAACSTGPVDVPVEPAAIPARTAVAKPSRKAGKGWFAVAHTRIGDDWCFAWAAWTEKPAARVWRSASAVGHVNQLDEHGAVVVDALEQAIAEAARALAGGALLTRIEDGFALAAHREVAGEEPRYRPVAAPGMVAEAYYAVIEVDRTMALPKQAVTVVQRDPKGNQLAVVSTGDPLAKRHKPTGRRVFWAVWATCKPTLEPWTSPDDLGIVEGEGAFEQAIGAADEACRRIRGEKCYAYSVGERFAARAYTDGARCTASKLSDISTAGLRALAWLGLDATATESMVSRAFGKKVKDEKLHPDQAADPEAKARAEEAFKAAGARRRAAIDYLAVLARSTGVATAFTQEKIEKKEARKQRAADKKAKARAESAEEELL